jgi:hypothetical protein
LNRFLAKERAHEAIRSGELSSREHIIEGDLELVLAL